MIKVAASAISLFWTESLSLVGITSREAKQSFIRGKEWFLLVTLLLSLPLRVSLIPPHLPWLNLQKAVLTLRVPGI